MRATFAGGFARAEDEAGLRLDFPPEGGDQVALEVPQAGGVPLDGWRCVVRTSGEVLGPTYM
jgi:hypothetical protein